MYSSLNVLRLTRLVTLLPLLLALGGGARAGTITIVLEGDAAPDANGSFSSFEDAPSLNDAGQTAFEAFLTGTAGGSSDNNGIFRGDGTTLTQVAREGQAAPDANGSYWNFYRPALNDAGQVAFRASLTGTAGGSSDSNGIFRGDGATLTQIARAGQAAPDANGVFSQFNEPAINEAGQAAFKSDLVSTAGGSADDGGVFRGDGTTLVQVAREGQAAPDANGTLGLVQSFVSLNDAGQAAFRAWFSGTSGGSADDFAILRGDGTTLIQIAREGQASPDANGSFAVLYEPTFNEAGEAAFDVLLNGSAGGTAEDTGIFRGDGTTLTKIVREGQATPDANGSFGDFSYTNPALNDAGQAAFVAPLTGTTGGSADDEGIFRGDGTTLAQIAREGQAAPDANGSLSVFGKPAITGGGTTAFQADLTGTAGGSADDAGLFLADPQEMLQVAREGQALEGSTIASLDFADAQNAVGRSGLNDFGQVAYHAELADGNEGVFLFTPDLRWRSAGSGAWDTSTNWTVGLAPGDPHSVSIDPSSGVTVTGPAADATIASLSLGATSDGTAVLRTNAGGDLTVTNGLDVDARGHLDHELGTLTAGAVTNAGTLNQDSGTLSLASLFNTGDATLSGAASVTGAVENRSQLEVSMGGSLTAGSLLNRAAMSLDGTLTSTGSVTNDYGASFTAEGTVDAALTNNGSLETTGFLELTGLLTNQGSIEVETAESLVVDGGLYNYASIDLTGGAITGDGSVTNQVGGVIRGGSSIAADLTNHGLIHANTAGATLVISDLSGGNSASGELRVEDEGTLLVQTPFFSYGTIALTGPTATLAGGEIDNYGTLSGEGRVGNTLANSGTIRSTGGQITLSGAGGSNASSGRIELATGGSVLYSQGLAVNDGSIALTGGAFDNNGNELFNNGSILGQGTFRSGGLTNADLVEFVDGDSNIFGAVTNDDMLRITDNTTTFFDPVTNSSSGTIKNTGATARFLAGLTNGGAYLSDPADNEFTDILLEETGYLVGGAGDRFIVSGDFLSASQALGDWETLAAELLFQGGGEHTLRYTGSDLGRSALGFVDNFAWGLLELGMGESLVLEDGDETSGGALYARVLSLEGGLAQIDSILGNGISLYYDPLREENAYLGGGTYALSGGGAILPVPEPGTALLLGLGLAGLARFGRRRGRA